MNIFVLSTDLRKNASYYNDKHVVKIALEIAQMLSTACRLNGLDVGYKACFVNHPVSKWVRLTQGNWEYAFNLALALEDEYRYRFGSNRSLKAVDIVRTLPSPKLPNVGLTRFAQAMPDDCKHINTVQAYRNYYKRHKVYFLVKGFAEFNSWTRRKVPFFMREILAEFGYFENCKYIL